MRTAGDACSEPFSAPDDPREWVQFAGSLVDRINAGDFKPGQMLPPINVLRGEAGLRSRQPVTKALMLLEERGILTRFPGVGYQVTSEGSRPPAGAAGRRLLAALRLVWDGSYMFSTAADGRFEVWRTDGTLTLSAATPEDLRDKVRADSPLYAAGTAL